MYSKFMMGAPLLSGGNTVPGQVLTKEEKEHFTQILKICRDYGCDFYDTVVQKLTYDEMSEVAAYGGFPRRFPHWKWGMEYEELQRGYEYGQHRIYEMVVNCLTLDTPLLTARGTIAARDVLVGDQMIVNNDTRKVVAVKIQKSSKVFNIKLRNGQTLSCTPNHKWRVLTSQGLDWKETKSLQFDDLLVGVDNYCFQKKPAKLQWSMDNVINNTRFNVRWALKDIAVPAEMTLILAELLGVLTGDGSVGVQGAENQIVVAIGKDYPYYAAHVIRLMNEVFGVQGRVGLAEKPSCLTVTLSSKFAVDFLNSIGFKKGSTYKNKRIPTSVWASSSEFRAAYLRGLFDTDGYASGVVGMSCYNSYLANDVQIMFTEMGIQTCLELVPNGTGKNGDEHFIHTVELRGMPALQKFQERIGFKHDYKMELLNQLLDKQYCRGGGCFVPYIQKQLINWSKSQKITAYSCPSLGRSIKHFEKEQVGINCLYSFIQRAELRYNKKIPSELHILAENPIFAVETIEISDDTKTIDIALDHDAHDFVAKGLLTHNTNPCYIYILNSNTLCDNICVVAHATFHNDFFKNNIRFLPTDQNMMNKLANHGSRILKYMDRWGIEKVTEFIDYVMRIQTLVDPAKAWDVREIKDYIIRDSREYELPRRLAINKDHLHMDPWINTQEWRESEHKRIKRLEAEREIGLFQQADKDIFGFIKNYAPMKPWQADILSMLYEEAMYFGPQRMTKTINEGWACLLKGSLVYTDKGIKKIEQIVEDKMEVNVFDGENFRKVTNWFTFDNRKIYKIKTKRGYELSGSATHKIYTENGWKQLKNCVAGDKVKISKGGDAWAKHLVGISWKKTLRPTMLSLCEKYQVGYDKVKRFRRGGNIRADKDKVISLINEYNSCIEQCGGYTQECRRKPINVPKYMDKKFATFLGFLVGDGHITSDGREIGFTNAEECLADLFMSLAYDLFGVTCSKKWDASSKNGRWRVKIYSVSLKEFLVSLGLTTGVSSRIKKIPDVILKSPKGVMSAFLRAYYDADGCPDETLILSTSSPEMFKQVQVVLLNYGILSSVYKKDKDNYHVTTCGESIKLFYQQIGFNSPIKQAALCKSVYGHPWFNKQNWVDEIDSVEEINTDTVYDITVDETHKYAAQGFINHNSFGDYEIMTRQGHVGMGQKTHDAGIVEYALHKMGVLGGKYSMNPYKIGFYLLLDIEERWNKGQFGHEWENCKDMHAKENWDKKLMLGKEKVFEVRKYYDDVTLIQEFFTQEFCDKFEFFEWKHYPNGEYRIESRDAKKIKQKLLQRHLNGGLPDIRLVDPNHRNKGWMLLQHSWDGRILHEPYARETLVALHYLWGREIILATRDKNNQEVVFICAGTDSDKDIALVSRYEYENKW